MGRTGRKGKKSNCLNLSFAEPAAQDDPIAQESSTTPQTQPIEQKPHKMCALCGTRCASWQECKLNQKPYNPDNYIMMSPAWNDIDHEKLQELVNAKMKELQEKFPHLTKGNCSEWIALTGGRDCSSRVVDTNGGGRLKDFISNHNLPLTGFGKDYTIPLLADKLPKKKANKKNVAKPKLSA